LCAVRLLMLSCLKLIAPLFLVAILATPALAQTASRPTSSTRLQRRIADDVNVDQDLVTHIASQTVAQPAPVVATNAPAPSETAEPEYEMASLGPALPIHPRFNPLWPTSGLITTYFGEVSPLSPRGHAGLDIANDNGTPILAADEGEVLKAYWDDSGYGGLIVIGHPSGYETWYGHLSRIGVEKGEHVDRGESIGRMGSTGMSTGPHLHFEVRQDGELRDPLNFLAESALKPIGN
jgi:murein DD-endopeptidase MepM/ murein hydrolase activator NlpD